MSKLKVSGALWFLVATWVLVQAALYIVQGIHTDLEATKYIDQAANVLSHGHYSAPKYFFYTTLIFIIALSVKIGTGYGGVVLFQILVNGIATICLFQLSKAASGKERTAFIATLLFILFFPVQTWNTYLYTESLFISLSLIFFYTVLRRPPVNFKNLAIGSLFLVLLTLTRPFGVLYILPYLAYAFLMSTPRFRMWLSIMSAVAIVAFFVLINFAFNGGEDMDAMKPFKEEHVICFMPSPKPVTLELSQTGSPVADIFYYIGHNPAHFAGLMFRRLASFFWLPKPYFSSLHNLYLAMVIVPVYLSALLALWKKTLAHPIVKFTILLLLIYSVGMTFQCNDYHNRFIMPLFGLILMLAASGIDYGLSYIRSVGRKGV
jgi:hypothetical protein